MAGRLPYVYDAGDRLTSQDISGTTTSYGYDNANQLTSENSTAYAFDAAGNRNNAGFTPASGNQLQSDSAWTTYVYDGEGNVIEKLSSTSNESWVYGYDNLNHLVIAQHYSGSDPGTGTLVLQVSYAFDALGNRVERDQWFSGSTTHQRYSYDGSSIWADLDGSDNLQARHFTTDAVDQLFARINYSGGTGTLMFYLTDRENTVRDLLGTSGTVLDHLTYDAWGALLSESASAVGDRYKFTGREFDTGTGLQYNRARDYDPNAERWMQQDPSGFAAGDSNLNRYAGTGPTVGTDPSGQYTDPTDPAGQEARTGAQSVPGQAKQKQQLDKQQRFDLAYASGFELGSKKAKGSFQEVRQQVQDCLSDTDFRAFASGYAMGEYAQLPEMVKQSREQKAAQLEQSVQEMESARERSSWNPLRWIGSSHSAMSTEEYLARAQIDGLRNPLNASEAARYASWGKAGFNTNHALQAPGLADDPIVMLATLGTGLLAGGLSKAALAGLATREGAKRIGIATGISISTDLIDQTIRIANGRQAGLDYSELALSGTIGLVTLPVIAFAPGLGAAGSVLGLASATDAVGEGQSLLAGFRATTSLFGPSVARRLIRGGSLTNLRASANAALKKFIGELQAAGQRPAAAIAAYDLRTGKIVTVTSGEVPVNVNPVLARLAQDAGGLGVKTPCGNTIGRCAEFRGANDLLNAGSRLEDIRFTNAIRPRTGELMPTCDNCRVIFGKTLLGE